VLSIPLNEFYNGAIRKVEFSQKVICTTCHGSGTPKVGFDSNCSQCKGTGVEMKIRKLGPGMIQQSQQECSQCGGKGTFIPKKDRCTTCDGQGIVTQSKRLEVNIKPGMNPGERIYFRKEAHQSPGATSGDVILILSEAPHPTYIRRGADLFMTQNISLVESLGGFSIPLETLDKRRIKIKLDPNSHIIANGEVKLIKGEGMPLQSIPSQKGNLYIKFNLTFPKTAILDDKSAKNLETQLGQKRRQDTSGDKEVILQDTTGSTGNFDFEAYRKEQERRDQEIKYQRRKKSKEDEEGQPQCTQM